MLIFWILLIPIKLLFKIILYILGGVLKLIGSIITIICSSCGLLLRLFGVFAILVGFVFALFGIFNIANVQQMEHWWVAAIAACVMGALIALLPQLGENLGAGISDFGSYLWDISNDIRLLPH